MAGIDGDSLFKICFVDPRSWFIQGVSPEQFTYEHIDCKSNNIHLYSTFQKYANIHLW